MWNIPKIWEDTYLNIVQKAIEDEETFKTFRHNKQYTLIVSDCMKSEMIEALYNYINQNSNDTNILEKARISDNIGSPHLHPIYNICPTTLRYIQTALIIKKHFGNITNVSEIGIGYGGLCYIICNIFNISYYSMTDFPPVITLAKKFLTQLPITQKLLYKKEFTNHVQPYDIVISEYTITELRWEVVTQYYKNILCNSKHLFIRTNYNKQKDMNKFLEILNQDFELQILPQYDDADEFQKIVLGTRRYI